MKLTFIIKFLMLTGGMDGTRKYNLQRFYRYLDGTAVKVTFPAGKLKSSHDIIRAIAGRGECEACAIKNALKNLAPIQRINIRTIEFKSAHLALPFVWA